MNRSIWSTPSIYLSCLNLCSILTDFPSLSQPGKLTVQRSTFTKKIMEIFLFLFHLFLIGSSSALSILPHHKKHGSQFSLNNMPEHCKTDKAPTWTHKAVAREFGLIDTWPGFGRFVQSSDWDKVSPLDFQSWQALSRNFVPALDSGRTMCTVGHCVSGWKFWHHSKMPKQFACCEKDSGDVFCKSYSFQFYPGMERSGELNRLAGLSLTAADTFSRPPVKPYVEPPPPYRPLPPSVRPFPKPESQGWWYRTSGGSGKSDEAGNPPDYEAENPFSDEAEIPSAFEIENSSRDEAEIPSAFEADNSFDEHSWGGMEKW